MFPRNGLFCFLGFFSPLILPTTILIDTTHCLSQPSPSALQTSIPSAGGGRLHYRGRMGNRRRPGPTPINVGLGKQRGRARPFPAPPSVAARTPFPQEPVGCLNATSVLVVQFQVQREWLLVKGPGFLWCGEEGTRSVLRPSRPQSWKALRGTGRAPQRGQYLLCPFSIHSETLTQTYSC